MISPKPNIRKSQYLAYQNSSGVDKNTKLNRFSPLKSEANESNDISPNSEIPKPIKNEGKYLADTSEFYSNVILSPDVSEDALSKDVL